MAAIKEPAKPDRLETIADQLDQKLNQVNNPEVSSDPASPVPGAPAGPDYATEAAALVDMVVAMIVGYEPRCAQFWPADRKAGVVAAAAPVMEKYNFSLGNIPPEIYLLIMAGPPLYQCSKLIAEGMGKPPAAAASPVISPDSQTLVVPGMESGTASHSAAMMDLAL